MVGYAATAHLGRVEPHRRRRDVASPKPLPVTAAAVDLERQPIDLSGEPFGDRFERIISGVAETWSQTVFYVCDPESWRR